YFNVRDQQKIGQPDVDAAYVTTFTINIEGQDLNFAKSVKYKFTDPVKGEVYEPVVVIPQITFRDFNPLYIKTDKQAGIEISFTANKTLRIPDPQTGFHSLSSKPDTVPFMVGGVALNKKQVYTESVSDKELDPHVYRLNAAPDSSHAGSIQRSITYDNIPYI